MALENDKSLTHIRALRPFMLNGRKVNKDDVVAKSEFQNTNDYMNLCAMTPPKAVQCEKSAAPVKGKALPGT